MHSPTPPAVTLDEGMNGRCSRAWPSRVMWPLANRWVRPLLVLYPIAMAFALVYTAEHYLADVFLGWIYTVAAVWAVAHIAAFLSRKRNETGRRQPVS